MAMTDGQGRYVLGGLPADADVSVIAKKDGYDYDHAWWLKTTSTKVTDAGKIALKEGISLGGSVHYEDGKPAVGAVVAIGWSDEAQKATADVSGAYQFTGLSHDKFYNEYTDLKATIGEPADWEGTARYNGRPQSGDRVGGVDIVLKRSMHSRLAEWEKKSGTAAESRMLAVVVDDADPAYKGKDVFDDTVTLLDGRGQSRWQRGGMNVNVWLQSHGVVANPADHSIWFAGNGLTKLKSDGVGGVREKRGQGEFAGGGSEKPGTCGC